MSLKRILSCDMKRDCTAAVTHIDNKGYVYCTEHGVKRKAVRPCRKLKPAELEQLRRGEPISY